MQLPPHIVTSAVISYSQIDLVGSEGRLNYLLHQSLMFYNDVFLFVGSITLVRCAITSVYYHICSVFIFENRHNGKQILSREEGDIGQFITLVPKVLL